MNFDHASLVCPLDRDGAQELCCRLVGFLAELEPRFPHVYEPKESATDPFVKRLRKAAKG
jgi:hypothetical protein